MILTGALSGLSSLTGLPSLAGGASVPLTVPDPPTDLAAGTSTSTTQPLTWVAPLNDGGPNIMYYTVYYKLHTDPTYTAWPIINALADTVTGLTHSLSYDYYVTATNAIGESAPSNVVTNSTQHTVPGAPTGLAGGNTTQKRSQTLTWVAPADNGGSAITNYEIWYGVHGGALSLFATVGNVLTGVVTGLTAGGSYDYYVKAINGVGTSAASNTLNLPAAWEPSLLGSQLYAWWDADHCTTSGSDVTQHTDQSGNARHLTPVSTNQTLVANGINTNRNVFRIGGSNAYAKTSQTNLATTDIIVMGVFKPGAGNGNTARFWDWTAYNTGAWMGIGATASTLGGGCKWQTGSPYGNFVSGSTSAFQMIGMFRDTANTLGYNVANGNGSQGVWINGDFANNQHSNNSDTAAFSAGSMAVGADQGGGSNIANTDWQAIVVCNALLSTQNRQRLEGYLMWEAGLQASLPTGHPWKNTWPV